MRSDLFPRSLEETLITDFFGAVAQVEIVPPTPFSSLSLSKQEGSTEIPNDTVDAKPNTNMSEMDGSTVFSDVVEEDIEGTETKGKWRAARVWSAFGLIGGLIGFVAFRSKPRR